MNGPSADVLAALLEKYRELSRLREDSCQGSREDGPSVAPRGDLRALSLRFPGALREIDILSSATIDERIRVLEGLVTAPGVAPLWLTAISRYHGWMRVVLRIKPFLQAHRHLDVREARALFLKTYHPAADEPHGDLLTVDVFESVRSPAEGRINPWVLGRVATCVGLSVEETSELLFPR
ncbi:MAG: hypothetical protein KC416_01900 [Myxococcales bacterium]|nr:hypothetical protein [Myxococcales bacterium]